MAFTTAMDRIRAAEQAGEVLGALRTIHRMALRLQAALTLYQGGTDTTFNATFNALFTPADRTAIAEMIGELSALTITDWEANHADALGIGG